MQRNHRNEIASNMRGEKLFATNAPNAPNFVDTRRSDVPEKKVRVVFEGLLADSWSLCSA